jgi:hypothetical protein
MEENNTFINEETVQNETEQNDIHQDEPAVEISFEPKPAPKKKTGGFKKLLTGLLSMVLIPSAVGFGSGIAAYKLMDNANDKVILQTIQFAASDEQALLDCFSVQSPVTADVAQILNAGDGNKPICRSSTERAGILFARHLYLIIIGGAGF